jgi:3',5'-cyclic AMP phosphodiesterase CpdA
MTLLLQISDPHFGTEQPPVAQALLRLATALRPDLVVMSGDITQRARRTQFNAARAFVDRFDATPFVVVPGNHDIPLYNLFALWRIPMRTIAVYSGTISNLCSNWPSCW